MLKCSSKTSPAYYNFWVPQSFECCPQVETQRLNVIILSAIAVMTTNKEYFCTSFKLASILQTVHLFVCIPKLYRTITNIGVICCITSSFAESTRTAGSVQVNWSYHFVMTTWTTFCAVFPQIVVPRCSIDFELPLVKAISKPTKHHFNGVDVWNFCFH